MISKFVNRLFAFSYFVKRSIQLAADTVLIIVSYAMAMSLRFDSFAFASNLNSWLVLLTVLPVTLAAFIHLGLYRAVIRYITAKALKSITIGVAISAVTMFVVSQAFTLPVPRSVPFIYFSLLLLFAGGVRFILRGINQSLMKDRRRPVAIYGAGDAGRQLLNSLDRAYEYRPVLFIDDDPKLNSREIGGLTVHSFEKATKLLESSEIKVILLAMPSVPRSVRKNIVGQLENYPVQVKTLPGMADLIEGKAQISELRNVSIEELLGREPVPPKPGLMSKNIKDKVVLVTGAGGSIGSELCRQIVTQGPQKLLLLDSSEFALYSIHIELQEFIREKELNIELVPIMTSVRNNVQINSSLSDHKVQTIYHAAAYKHVPLVEMNIPEGLSNNFFGTWDMANAAVKANVESFILISTDKAVRPTNFMGASKRLAELVCQAFAQEKHNTIFSMVRFGNVLGSSGSVIPRFREQIKAGGPITVTHKEINRYFMTIPEAAQLVIQAGSMAKGGEVFVLDMGKPVKIIDLAQKMARLHGLSPFIEGEQTDSSGDIAIQVTGLRPGEKLYEELLIGETSEETDHPRIQTAKEISLSMSQMKKLRGELEKAIKGLHFDKLVELIKSAPTGFSPVD